MKILSGGFWILFVVYAAVIDVALRFLPFKIPIPGFGSVSEYPAQSGGGSSVSFSFGSIKSGGGVLAVALLLAWVTPRVF